MTATKGIRNNEYFKTLVAVVLVIVIVFGLFFGLRSALNTSDPALTVVSGSMSIPYDAADNNFWLTLSTPFDRTLSVGDIIIVQGVNPKDLNTNYPNSDIIVFHEPGDYNTLIVHRIVKSETVDGTLYFITKGDGNGNTNPWRDAHVGIRHVGQQQPAGSSSKRRSWQGDFANSMVRMGNNFRA